MRLVNPMRGEFCEDFLENRHLCSFGVTEGIAAAIATAATSVGVGATTAGIIGGIGAGALVGAGGGALFEGITGGDPGQGALFGGITGGLAGGAGAVLSPTSAGAGAASAGGTSAGIGAAAAAPIAGGAAASAPVDFTSLAAQGADAVPLSAAATDVGAGTTSSFGAGGGGFFTPETQFTGGAAIGGGGAQIPTNFGGVVTPETQFTGGAPIGGGGGAVQPGGIDLQNPQLDALSAGQSGLVNTPSAITPSASVADLANPQIPGGIPSSDALLAAPRTNVTPGQVNQFLKTGAAPTGATGAPSITDAGPASGGSFLDKLWTGAGSFLDKLSTGAVNSVTKNPIGTAISGGGLLYNIAQGNKNSSQLNNLNSIANAQSQQGAAMEQYIQNGTLPPGVQAGITQATNAAVAAIKSKYASLGLAGSTMEQQDINSAQLNATTAGTQIALKLYDQGVSQSNIAASLYNEILGINQQQNAATGTAIANFASALGGGGNSGQTFKITQAP